MAERKIGDLKETVRTLLAHARLPHYLWSEALEYAYIILNHTYSAPIKGIPSKLLDNNNSVLLTKLKVFGCAAYKTKPETAVNFGTFAPPSLKGIFLGFAKDKKINLHHLNFRKCTESCRERLTFA